MVPLLVFAPGLTKFGPAIMLPRIGGPPILPYSPTPLIMSGLARLAMKGGWGDPANTRGPLGEGDLAPLWLRWGEELGLPK